MKFTSLISLFASTALCSAETFTPSSPAVPPPDGQSPRPDAHGPISVMADHTHAQGKLMLSYRFMHMDMDGMRSGTKSISSGDVFMADGGYTVSPENMSMDMHMFGIMYAPYDRLTLMLMANYLETEMDHSINPMAPAMLINAVGGDHFTTETSGWGDTKLSALYRFYREDNKKAHVGLGLSLPTGSIDERDRTPRPPNPSAGMPMPTFNVNQLPAPMQLGSGTFDLLPSITFAQQFEDWSWGAQANGVIRLEDENSNGYRLGHVFETIGWASYNLADWIGLNAGLSYKNTGRLKGTQDNVGLNGPMGLNSVTTAFDDNYGGDRLDAILGFNLVGTKGPFKGHRLAADVRLPVWQDLNGYQLETDLVATLGWKVSF